MKKILHDMLNDLAVAMGLVQAFLDEKLEPTRGRFEDILGALEHVDSSISQLRVESRADGLPRSESVLGAIVEGSPYAKVLVDGNGRITLVNGEAENLFGYPRDEMLGRSVEVLVPQRFKAEHPGLRHGYDRRPEARPMGAGRDLFGRRKDGSEFPIEIGLNPIETDAGRFTLAAISDITERKRAEQLRLLHVGVQQHANELEQLNRELASASLFKTQFIATMSHELRTPLAAIIGATELLAKAPLPEREAESVATINESAEALFALIGSLLDFSKIEAGKTDLHMRPFDVAAVVASAIEVVAPLARKKDVVLQVDIDPRLGRMIGDGDRLRQILLNLVGNAAKFTERGGIFVRAFEVGVAGRATVVRFEVQDTGIGVPESFVPHLFEPFAQAAHSPTRHFGGSGLGLSISKRLVELMGGEIAVSSEPGVGSLFWFTAEFETISQPETLNADPSPGHATHAGESQRPHSRASERPVLVAEDDMRLQRLLKMQFDELGIPVSFVGDGKAAIEAVRDGAYAMVLMDCQMPAVDGLAATRAIRARERSSGTHIPIAAMTANAFSEDRDACIAAGMDDYLAKPAKLADLRAIVERWSPNTVRRP